MEKIDDGLKALLESGKEKGYLTYSQVNDHLPDDDANPEKIDQLLLLMLEEQGIELIDEAEAEEREGVPLLDDEARDLRDEAAAEERGMGLKLKHIVTVGRRYERLSAPAKIRGQIDRLRERALGGGRARRGWDCQVVLGDLTVHNRGCTYHYDLVLHYSPGSRTRRRVRQEQVDKELDNIVQIIQSAGNASGWQVVSVNGCPRPPRPSTGRAARQARPAPVPRAAEERTGANPSIRGSATVREAIALITDNGFSAVPVIDEAGRPIGVVSRTDILIHGRESVEVVDPTRVRDIMTPAIFTVTPQTPADKVVETMLAFHVHQLFVVDEDEALVGVISALDVLRHL